MGTSAQFMGLTVEYCVLLHLCVPVQLCDYRREHSAQRPGPGHDFRLRSAHEIVVLALSILVLGTYSRSADSLFDMCHDDGESNSARARTNTL